MISHFFRSMLFSFVLNLACIVLYSFGYAETEAGVEGDFYRGAILLIFYLLWTHLIFGLLLIVYWLIKVTERAELRVVIVAIPHLLFAGLLLKFKGGDRVIFWIQEMVNLLTLAYSLKVFVFSRTKPREPSSSQG